VGGRRKRSHAGGRGRRQGRQSCGGGEASQCAPPRFLVAVQQFLQRGRGKYIGNNGQQTNNNQKLTKGGFQQGSQLRAPTNHPQKRHNLPLGLGGGVAGFDLAQKGRAGDAIIMRWTMTMMTMARGGSMGKIINDSISEHKCIVTTIVTLFSLSLLSYQ
jgi:hypothetical protein